MMKRVLVAAVVVRNYPRTMMLRPSHTMRFNLNVVTKRFHSDDEDDDHHDHDHKEIPPKEKLPPAPNNMAGLREADLSMYFDPERIVDLSKDPWIQETVAAKMLQHNNKRANNSSMFADNEDPAKMYEFRQRIEQCRGQANYRESINEILQDMSDCNMAPDLAMFRQMNSIVEEAEMEKSTNLPKAKRRKEAEIAQLFANPVKHQPDEFITRKYTQEEFSEILKDRIAKFKREE